MDLSRYVPSKIGEAAFVRRLATYLRRAASPGAAVALLRMNTQIDIRHVLPTIRVPTLVLHRVGDRDANVEEGRWLAARIPGARYVELPGDDHLPGSATRRTLDEIEEFLTGVRPRRSSIAYWPPCCSPTSSVRRDLAARPAIARGTVCSSSITRWFDGNSLAFRGREVDTAGDGFFATFDGPARAIRWRCSIRDAVRELGIAIRAGLHTGE